MEFVSCNCEDEERLVKEAEFSLSRDVEMTTRTESSDLENKTLDGLTTEFSEPVFDPSTAKTDETVVDISSLDGSCVPVLDLDGLLEINQAVTKADISPKILEMCYKIGLATKNIGFFVAAPTHGVKGLKEIEALAKRFFALPETEKQKYSMMNNSTFRGYMSLFSEISGESKVSDYKSSFDLGTQHPENKGKDTFLGFTDYPDEEFERVCETYHNEMRAFGNAVMRAFAVYLDLPLDSMTTPVGTENENHLYRLLSYPPVKPNMDRKTLMHEHYDYGMLAMVVATSGGLEVKNIKNEWVDVPFIPGSITVNIGDMIEIFTNGHFKSTLHRVNTNQNNNWRFSFPFFLEPSFDAIIAPLITPSDGKPSKTPIVYADHVQIGTSKSFKQHPFSQKWLKK